ncbi:Undecaprenyl diphosphate synthase [Annulohypoxylon maeteangense]|uniref:Undecaprenyl diphosphate synthase n=1 Tax=Annulohypoxylon maeteangense TaxID=1927788 RepID=UPI002008A7F8|nr:Undecaprenyl diphosphate synthase [Annulohypoxylon maeteangense]KAI0884861.1 Undecaprenyl diphosphate synthase [Annulohypoxylon maeteangense]
MSDLYLSHVRNWILKSPPAEWVIRSGRELLIGTLKQGPIPQHVAFEMDGNRRFAKNHKIETIEGHHLGFEALARVLEICYKCGVKVVTVYAFSIENFNRPRHEVSGLMAMAKVKLEQLVQHGELLDRYGAGVRVLGERDLIPDDVLPFVDRAIEMTKHNKDAVLNICFPYTSRAEMTSAIKATVDEYTNPPRPASTPFSQSRITQKIRSNRSKKSGSSSPRDSSPDGNGKSDVDDSMSSTTALDPESPPLSSTLVKPVKFQNPETITAETINSHTYTAECPPLDMFIRTSGVTRLSDFMLWQCHENTQIFFLKCLWPEFDLWHFIPILLEWQWRQKKLSEKETPRK